MDDSTFFVIALLLIEILSVACQSNESADDVYDFIIVGAGTSGCVLANRLSRITSWKILVLEAGDEENIDYDIPAIPTNNYKAIQWNYKTARNNFSCLSRPGGVCHIPSGKIVGGTSVINDMVYARGSKYDFEEWGEAGNEGWNYEDVLAYFKISEDYGEDISSGSDVHSKGGELHVEQLLHGDINIKYFASAIRELGVKTKDINDSPMESVTSNVYAHLNNTRLSSNGAFLMPVRKRSNLIVKIKATATKIILESGTMTAVGVMYEMGKNSTLFAFARKEIILAAGVFNSPKILMLSGIGPEEELSKHNITNVVDLPVGQFYQDQVTAGGLSFSIKSALPSEHELRQSFMLWFKDRSGPLKSKGIAQLAAYLQLYENKKIPAPDVMFMFETNYLQNENFLLANISVYASEEQTIPISFYNTINIKPVILRPKSRGYISLNPRDPIKGDPIIHANLLQKAGDVETLEYALDVAFQLLESKHLKSLGVKLTPLDLYPCDQLKDRAKWRCVAKHFTKAMGNGIGTCKMGMKTDISSVVAPDLKVHGVNNLRVADASIMPTNVRSSNNYAVSVMIGEKASHMIEDYWRKKQKS